MVSILVLLDESRRAGRHHRVAGCFGVSILVLLDESRRGHFSIKSLKIKNLSSKRMANCTRFTGEKPLPEGSYSILSASKNSGFIIEN
jgi:hypothetical protein